MDNCIEKINYKDLEIEICQDLDPLDPRKDLDNFGKMVCFHRRYTLGDKHAFYNPEELNDFLKVRKDIVFLNLYLYDHSGISMSTGRQYPFNCQWDSGQVGIIYADYETIKKEFNIKKVTKKYIDKAYKILQAEVDCYDHYISGQVYGYNSEAVSCWGYYETKDAENDAKLEIDCYIKDKIKAHAEKLKAQIKSHVSIDYRKPLTI